MDDDRWLILRTRSRDTLALVKDLLAAGFDAWAPKRTFAKQGKGEMLTLTAPLLPSFAFARASHIHALLVLADEPVKPCPDFSVFHYNDRIPVVRDDELHRMRQIEANDLKRLEAARKPRRREIKFFPGDTIRLAIGAWAGKVGTVERDDGKTINLSVEGWPVKISAFHLTDEMAFIAQQPAAKAA